MKPRKIRAREIQDNIRQILFDDWNPLGINDEPTLADEYDAYIGNVYHALVSGSSENELIELLRNLESEITGESPAIVREKLLGVAHKLINLDVAL